MKDPATIALCVGHSRRLADQRPEGGAATHGPATTSTNEWEYNRVLARGVAAVLHDTNGISAYVVDCYEGNTYSAAMGWLARELSGLGNIRLAVELHFNSADSSQARGHEWLYWESSAKGKLAATELHLAMSRRFPSIPARGVKARRSGDRGAEFLRRTHCPAVIAEPFFGSNAEDWALVRDSTSTLILALAEGIAAVHKRL